MLKSFNEFNNPINESDSNQTTAEFYTALLDFAKSDKVISITNFDEARDSKIIKNVQLALNFLGYPLPSSEMNGLLGPQTVIAIRKFKAAAGLIPSAPKKNYTEDPNAVLKAVDLQSMYGNY